MALNFRSQETDSAEHDVSPAEQTFSVSAAPVIPERKGGPRRRADEDPALARSYGMEALWLLPRDPHSLFAYWDINWKAAFGEENPKPRKVQLRVLNADGSEQVSLEVEPMAGQCNVKVAQADAAYHAEIGFSNSAGDWQVVSRSESVNVPPAVEGGSAPADFSTVPLHLSFQHMLDATRSAQEQIDSLTETLGQLRERVAQADETVTAQQRDVIRTIEEAAARAPGASFRKTDAPDLWAHHSLEKIFGFGNSSLSRAFGGSSR